LWRCRRWWWWNILRVVREFGNYRCCWARRCRWGAEIIIVIIFKKIDIDYFRCVRTTGILDWNRNKCGFSGFAYAGERRFTIREY